jgi:hypothetical protein
VFTGRRYATADEGIDREEGFRRFRFSSARTAARGSVLFLDRYKAWISAGLATVRIHASEGETIEFRNAAAGELGLRVRLAEWPGNGLGAYASASVFHMSGDDPEVVRVNRRYLEAGDGNLTWTESACALELERRVGRTVFFGGIRYAYIDAGQKRALPGEPEVESSFDMEDTIGLFAGVSCELTDLLSVSGTARFADETAFAAGLSFDF